MERTELKWLTGGFGLLVLAMLFLFSQSLTSKSNSSEARRVIEELMTVAMPRPIKEMIAGFSLADRNVTRQLVTTGNKGMPGYNKSMNAAANAKKAAATAKKKKPSKKDNRKAWAEYYARQEAFRARIIAESERYRQTLIEQANEKMAQDYQEYNAYIQKKAEAKKVVKGEEQVEDEKETLDPAAWKSLVLDQPTAENVQKMLKAFQSGELDAQTYFEIVETLARDNNEERRKMGMWALTSTFHPQAFALASHLAAEGDATSQKQLKDYMYGYNRPQTLAHLDQILRSQDMVAATAAADVITRAIEKLRTGQPPVANEGRGGRVTPQGQTLTLASYQRFIPTLQWLSTNQGNTLAQWAQNILSQLRTTPTPA